MARVQNGRVLPTFLPATPANEETSVEKLLKNLVQTQQRMFCKLQRYEDSLSRQSRQQYKTELVKKITGGVCKDLHEKFEKHADWAHEASTKGQTSHLVIEQVGLELDFDQPYEGMDSMDVPLVDSFAAPTMLEDCKVTIRKKEEPKIQEHVDGCEQEERHDSENSVWVSSLHHEAHKFLLLENPLKAPISGGIWHTLGGSATRVIPTLVGGDVRGSGWVEHTLYTMEEHFSRLYEASCLREWIAETKRWPNKKILQFDNVWFVMDPTPWSWMGEKFISAEDVRVGINFVTAIVARTHNFQLGTPLRPALMEGQPIREEDTRKDKEETAKRHKHSYNLLKRTQWLCVGWSTRANKAKMLAAQARQHLQEVKEGCHLIDNARRQRESHIRSLFLPKEECVNVEYTNTGKRKPNHQCMGEELLEDIPTTSRSLLPSFQEETFKFNTSFLQQNQLNKEVDSKYAVDWLSASTIEVYVEEKLAREIESEKEEDRFPHNESAVASGNSCTSLIGGNVEIMLDISGKVWTNFDDSMSHTTAAPPSPHDRFDPNDDGDTTVESNIALLLNQQECKDDISEEDFDVSQTLQGPPATSSDNKEVVHKQRLGEPDNFKDAHKFWDSLKDTIGRHGTEPNLIMQRSNNSSPLFDHNTTSSWNYLDNGVISAPGSQLENVMYGSPSHMDELGQGPFNVQDLRERFVVSEDEVVRALTREGSIHNYIDNLIWKTQIKERKKGVVNGVTSSQLCTIKEALEQMKSDYLQLLKDRDLAIKFAEDQEREIDDLCLQLSMAHSLMYKAESQTPIVATNKTDGVDAKTNEIMQIVEGINALCENDSSNDVAAPTVSKGRFQNSFSYRAAIIDEFPMLEEIGHKEVLKPGKDKGGFPRPNDGMLIGFDNHNVVDVLYASNLGGEHHSFQEFVALYEAASINPFPSIVFSVKMGAISMTVSAKYSHFRITKVKVGKMSLGGDRERSHEVAKNQFFSSNDTGSLGCSKFANMFLCDNRLPDRKFDRVAQGKHDGYEPNGCEYRFLWEEGGTYQLDCIVRSACHFSFSSQIGELDMFMRTDKRGLNDWCEENHTSTWYEMYSPLEEEFAACRNSSLRFPDDCYAELQGCEAEDELKFSGCAVLTGPYIRHFAQMVTEMQRLVPLSVKQVSRKGELLTVLQDLLDNVSFLEACREAAIQASLTAAAGAVHRVWYLLDTFVLTKAFGKAATPCGLPGEGNESIRSQIWPWDPRIHVQIGFLVHGLLSSLAKLDRNAKFSRIMWVHQIDDRIFFRFIWDPGNGMQIHGCLRTSNL